MGEVVKKNQSWAVEIEATQGVYAPPAAASSFVQTMTEGSEMSRSKELLERDVYTFSIGKTAPRTGQFSVSGSMAVEARAHSTQGSAPEYDALLRSALGARRQLLAEVATGVGNTATILQVEDANLSFAYGDIILIKAPGAFHVSPVKAVTETTVELFIPAAAPLPDNVVIAKHTTYCVADAGHPSLSVSRYLEGAVIQKGIGCKVTSLALEGFTTGQMPSFNFGFEGLNFDQVLGAPPFAPAYDSQVPPIILAARMYMDALAVDVNEMSFSLENVLGFKTSVSAENGRVSSRPTERTITGSINPYMDSESNATFLKFKQNTPFSLFGYAKLPTATAGEFGGIIAVFMPNNMITELAEGDQDGIMQDSITFSANRGNTGTIPEIFIGII